MIDLLAEARKLIAWASDDDGEGVTNQAAALFYAAATAYATLAIAEDLTNRRPAGACPWYLYLPDGRLFCRHPSNHTGLHANDPNIDAYGTECRWTDTTASAARIDQETT